MSSVFKYKVGDRVRLKEVVLIDSTRLYLWDHWRVYWSQHPALDDDRLVYITKTFHDHNGKCRYRYHTENRKELGPMGTEDFFEEITMFKVGKKYIYRDGSNGYLYECLFIGRESAFMVNLNTSTEFTVDVNDNRYPEHIEPRVEYFNAFKCDDGKTYYQGPFISREIADGCGSHRYGILTMTHHSETNVETHFILTRKT